MSRVIAGITTSVDGYVTGPDDGPGCGLGVGGERLHNWVMGGPWTYEGEHAFAMSEEDRAFYDDYVANIGSGVVGRGMYDASGAWGGTNPFGGTLHVVTHRTEDARTPRRGSSSWTTSTAPSSSPRVGRRPRRGDQRRRGRDPAGTAAAGTSTCWRSPRLR